MNGRNGIGETDSHRMRESHTHSERNAEKRQKACALYILHIKSKTNPRRRGDAHRNGLNTINSTASEFSHHRSESTVAASIINSLCVRGEHYRVLITSDQSPVFIDRNSRRYVSGKYTHYAAK